MKLKELYDLLCYVQNKLEDDPVDYLLPSRLAVNLRRMRDAAERARPMAKTLLDRQERDERRVRKAQHPDLFTATTSRITVVGIDNIESFKPDDDDPEPSGAANLPLDSPVALILDGDGVEVPCFERKVFEEAMTPESPPSLIEKAFTEFGATLVTVEGELEKPNGTEGGQEPPLPAQIETDPTNSPHKPVGDQDLPFDTEIKEGARLRITGGQVAMIRKVIAPCKADHSLERVEYEVGGVIYETNIERFKEIML